MFAIKTFGPASRVVIGVSILCLLIAAAPALASGGGEVLPPGAKPHGYSLAEAAAATAYFNTGSRTPDTLPNDFPFQILYVAPGDTGNTFSVKAGTMFYVPAVYSDDTDAALWRYPDVTNPEAVSAYYFDPKQLGAEVISLEVDGKVSKLGPAYAVGAVTPGLPSGGNNYTVAAAFLTPLSQGVHTVKIASRFSGAFIAMYPDYFPGGVFESESTYTVIVH
jgi:hypothetical protein